MTQIYQTGTVTVTNGSTAVTGDDTGWATALVTGGLFTRNGLAVPIESVEGEDALTLALPWPGSSGSGAYAIMRENSAAASVVNAVTKLTEATRTLSLSAVHPNATGTLAERDALDLAPDRTDFIFERMEDGHPEERYRWGGFAWVGPFPVRGPPGQNALDGVQSSDASVTDIIALTQTEYDLIDTPSASTFYIIKPEE